MKSILDISLSSFNGYPVKGLSSFEFQKMVSTGISLGYSSWLKTVVLATKGEGLVGLSGTIQGQFIVPLSLDVVIGSFVSNGIQGVLAKDLALSLTMGIKGSYSLGGISSGLGVGAFTGTGLNLVCDLGSLQVLLNSSLKGEGIIFSEKICFGIAQGIYSLLKLGQVLSGVVIGVPSQPSSPASLPIQALLY